MSEPSRTNVPSTHWTIWQAFLAKTLIAILMATSTGTRYKSPGSLWLRAERRWLSTTKSNCQQTSEERQVLALVLR